MTQIVECELYIVPIHNNADELFAAAKKGVRFINHAVQNEIDDTDLDNAEELAKTVYKKATSEKVKSKFNKFKHKIKKAFSSNKEEESSEEDTDDQEVVLVEKQNDNKEYDPWGISGHEKIDLEDCASCILLSHRVVLLLQYGQIKIADEMTDDLRKRLHKWNPNIEPPVLRDHIKMVTTAYSSFSERDLPEDYVSDPISIGVVRFSNGHMYDVSYVNRIVEYGNNDYQIASSWQKWSKDFDVDEVFYEELLEDLPDIPNDGLI